MNVMNLSRGFKGDMAAANIAVFGDCSRAVYPNAVYPSAIYSKTVYINALYISAFFLSAICIGATNAAYANDALADNLPMALVMYWKDAALLVMFLAGIIFWGMARRVLRRQQESQDEMQQKQQQQQEEYFQQFAEKLKTLDERFQRDIKDFSEAASKRTAGGEKMLRAQEHAMKKAMETLWQHADEIGQTMETLRAALDSKDVEIRRLKEGHDAVVWAKFVRRFIRVHQYIDDLLADDVEGAYLLKIKLRLDGALEECGVEPFAPMIGSRYDEQADGALDESPEEMPCVAPDDEFKIISIIQRGYRLLDSGKIIAPAKVKIYAAARPRQRDNIESIK